MEEHPTAQQLKMPEMVMTRVETEVETGMANETALADLRIGFHDSDAELVDRSRMGEGWSSVSA